MKASLAKFYKRNIYFDTTKEVIYEFYLYENILILILCIYIQFCLRLSNQGQDQHVYVRINILKTMITPFNKGFIKHCYKDSNLFNSRPYM